MIFKKKSETVKEKKSYIGLRLVYSYSVYPKKLESSPITSVEGLENKFFAKQNITIVHQPFQVLFDFLLSIPLTCSKYSILRFLELAPQ